MRAYVAVGSNLGDRWARLAQAARLLRAAPGVAVVRGSRVWDAAPVGAAPAPLPERGARARDHPHAPRRSSRSSARRRARPVGPATSTGGRARSTSTSCSWATSWCGSRASPFPIPSWRTAASCSRRSPSCTRSWSSPGWACRWGGSSRRRRSWISRRWADTRSSDGPLLRVGPFALLAAVAAAWPHPGSGSRPATRCTGDPRGRPWADLSSRSVGVPLLMGRSPWPGSGAPPVHPRQLRAGARPGPGPEAARRRHHRHAVAHGPACSDSPPCRARVPGSWSREPGWGSSSCPWR